MTINREHDEDDEESRVGDDVKRSLYSNGSRSRPPIGLWVNRSFLNPLRITHQTPRSTNKIFCQVKNKRREGEREREIME